jgi:hypothetical protein
MIEAFFFQFPHNLEADNHNPLLIDLSKLWLFGIRALNTTKNEKKGVEMCRKAQHLSYKYWLIPSY